MRDKVSYNNQVKNARERGGGGEIEDVLDMTEIAIIIVKIAGK